MTFLTNAKGEPLLLLGTQTHNSSVGDPEMMARELAAVKAYGGNLLEAPIYWYKLEREPGQYDFSDVDGSAPAKTVIPIMCPNGSNCIPKRIVWLRGRTAGMWLL